MKNATYDERIDAAEEAYLEAKYLTLPELEEKYGYALTAADTEQGVRHCRQKVRGYLRAWIEKHS